MRFRESFVNNVQSTFGYKTAEIFSIPCCKNRSGLLPGADATELRAACRNLPPTAAVACFDFHADAMTKWHGSDTRVRLVDACMTPIGAEAGDRRRGQMKGTLLSPTRVADPRAPALKGLQQ